MAETKKKSPTIPANAKKPQDRQTAKKDALPQETVLEWQGETYTIAADAFDDVEIVEYLAEAQAGQPHMYLLAVKTLLGTQEWARWKANAKAEAENGRISQKDARAFFDHVMTEARQGN